jgi:hypothetical protein
MNKVIPCLAILIVLLLILKSNVFENFNLGIGYGFRDYIPPQDCTPKNNCFKGAYLRSQAYQNVCSPKYGRLNREKIQLQDDCLRTLGGYPKTKYMFECNVDEHLNRKCRWRNTEESSVNQNKRSCGRTCGCKN